MGLSRYRSTYYTPSTGTTVYEQHSLLCVAAALLLSALLCCGLWVRSPSPLALSEPSDYCYSAAAADLIWRPLQLLVSGVIDS